VDPIARIVLGLLVAASTAAAGMLLAIALRARRERTARDETMRRVRRRATLSGQWDPFDASNQALLAYERPPLRLWRAALRSGLAGAAAGFIAFMALPAGTTGRDDGPNAVVQRTPAPTAVASIVPPVTSEPTRTPTPTTVTSASVTPSSNAPAFVPESFFIADTGGIGVWVRTACSDRARTNDAWEEGQVVRTVEAESSDCVGWRLVELRGVRSWVEEQYLQPAPPP